jgi:thiamine-monophosphate kinase
MGAVPTALLVALCAPPDLPTTWAEELADGLGRRPRPPVPRWSAADLSASPTLTIAVTALGDLEGRAPVTRAGARPGDVLAVAGRLGHAAAGYTVLCRGFRTPKVLGRRPPPARGALRRRPGGG